jgi:hypothetical protein
MNLWRGNRRCGRAQPDIEVELIHRLRASRPGVIDRGISPDADPGRLQPRERRLISRNCLAEDDVLDQELGVVIQLRGQVQALITSPVAIASKPDEIYDPLSRLRWIGLQPPHERTLRQRPGNLITPRTSILRHSTPPSDALRSRNPPSRDSGPRKRFAARGCPAQGSDDPSFAARRLTGHCPAGRSLVLRVPRSASPLRPPAGSARAGSRCDHHMCCT